MAFKTFHKGTYPISIKRGFEDSRKDITVTVDKVFESDTLRITLSNDDDPTFLYVLHLTRCDFEELKKQQGLLVDFDNFPSQLVRLLQQCSSNNMFIILLQSNPVQYYFEIVEHNEFRKLVHLSLKTGPATDTDIKQHMSETILLLKNTLAQTKHSAANNEAIWNDKCLNMEKKIHELLETVSKLENIKQKNEMEFQETMKQERDRLMQERLQFQKNLEASTQSQIVNSQEFLKLKDKKIEELNIFAKQLQEKNVKLENQLSDKLQRITMAENEVQKSHIEVATMKAKNANLEREITEKDKQYYHLNTKYVQLEKVHKEQAQTIEDLNKSLLITRKEKTNLEEQLALAESLLNKNNGAVQTTTEQLLKANQIISKQNSDLIEMKEKLLCRTAIVLEQEKVIENNSKEIEELKQEITTSKQNIDKLKIDLEALTKKYECSEKALQDRDETIKNNNMVIQWLHKKVENSFGPEVIQTGSSKEPYFIPRTNNNSLHAESDESINFYATSNSKLSNIEDSPVLMNKKKSNMGLDPKYLKPATDDVKGYSTGKTQPGFGDRHKNKGKENKKIELPKVDYRESKPGKNNVYRSTPVSAYFP